MHCPAHSEPCLCQAYLVCLGWTFRPPCAGSLSLVRVLCYQRALAGQLIVCACLLFVCAPYLPHTHFSHLVVSNGSQSFKLQMLSHASSQAFRLCYMSLIHVCCCFVAFPA